MPSDDLPDIASMKISDLKKELAVYGVDSSGFCEKTEFTSALQHARETLPRPTTTYREPEPPDQPEKKPASSKSAKKPSSKKHHPSPPSSGSAPAPAPRPAAPQAAPAPAPAPKKDKTNSKRLLASRSPVTALQQLREHPSEKLIGERNNSFLPGSPFSFALHGSLQETDAAIIQIPDGVCLNINAASVERKAIEAYLLQKGSIGVSLKVSTEENPQLMPIWTFDKEKSKSYTVSDLGLRVCGPRKIRLLAFMEMGFRSGASVDVFVFGSVGLDRDKFA
ncbi:hypothetical protein ACHAXT_005296 [Thalassiosira profunda]